MKKEIEKLRKLISQLQEEQLFHASLQLKNIIESLEKALEHFNQNKGLSAEEFYDKKYPSHKHVAGVHRFLDRFEIIKLMEEYANQSQSNEVSDEKLEELNKEFYVYFQMIELDKHDKKVPQFDYYTLLGYAEEFYKWMQSRQSSKKNYSEEDKKFIKQYLGEEIKPNERLLDAIKRHNDKQSSNNGWISVEDRLPEFDKDVLVNINEFYYTAYLTEFGWEVSDEGRNLENVTHWQPLPQPPKQ